MYLFFAWLVALVASLAALFIGEVLGQTPCNLCWFQRVFMLPLPIILGIAVWKSDWEIWRYCFPLSIIGLLVALYHLLLYAGILPMPIVPCKASGPSCIGNSMLVFSIPLPGLAVVAFALISTLLLALRKAIK
ncbi:hypothetical protein SU32_15930 [Ahrensia marina]|uniref:Disulfide bond formation protein n=1 Tax=Ahrensia marina TaxID=1514904 RepID=A0A0M9GL94_9HYPH|nr:hypothetical protein SU32_15930 [Ahrensia marina]